MEHTVDRVMRLIAAELGGKPSGITALTDEEASALFQIASHHGISPIFSSAVLHQKLLSAESAMTQVLTRDIYSSVFRIEAQEYELKKVSAVLTEAEIPHMLLKGTVLRRYYPDPWMRSSRDMDLLVKPEDHARAVEILTEKLGYVLHEESSHDALLRSSSGYCTELHYTLVEDFVSEDAAKELNNVWATAIHDGESPYCYRMDDVSFCYYHLVHMAKHIRCGGCGLRPFVDLWILKKHLGKISEDIEKRIAAAGLATFYRMAESMCGIWFEGDAHNKGTLLFCDYLHEGGLSGSSDLSHAYQILQEKGKVRYVLSRVFISPRRLMQQYTVLEKYPLLYPFFAFHRLLSLVFGKRRGIRQDELRGIKGATNEKQEMIAQLRNVFGDDHFWK